MSVFDITAVIFYLVQQVHVAPISKIVIDTSTRAITVDSVETVNVRAFDGDGNVFSSIEGLWFKWELADSSEFLHDDNFS